MVRSIQCISKMYGYLIQHRRQSIKINPRTIVMFTFFEIRQAIPASTYKKSHELLAVH